MCKLCLPHPLRFFFPVTHQYLNLLNVFCVSLSLPSGSGIPPTQLSKYGNLGHVNIGLVQEPLAFLLPKRELVLCLDEKELGPELAAPAPAAEESSLEPVAAARPEDAQDQADSAQDQADSANEPQAEVPGADT